MKIFNHPQMLIICCKEITHYCQKVFTSSKWRIKHLQSLILYSKDIAFNWQKFSMVLNETCNISMWLQHLPSQIGLFHWEYLKLICALSTQSPYYITFHSQECNIFFTVWGQIVIHCKTDHISFPKWVIERRSISNFYLIFQF